MTDSTTLLNRILPSPPAPDAETRKEVKEERDGLYADLKKFQETIQKDKDQERISPETATELQAIVLAAQEWMRKNPNANLLEIRSQRDDLQQKAEPILERDKPRTTLDKFLLKVKSYLDTSAQQQKYTKRQLDAAKEVYSQENKWATKNRAEQGLVYTQRLAAFKGDLGKALEVPLDTMSALEKSVKDMKLSDIKENVKVQEIANQQKEANTYSASRLAETIFSTALSVFLGLILIVFFLFGGSLAANMAIGRDVKYRIFYFVIGCLPWVAPVIYIYGMLSALRGTAPHYYGFLPVSTTPASTMIGKILWTPFFYEADANSQTQRSVFLQSVEDIGRAVLQVPKAPGPA